MKTVRDWKIALPKIKDVTKVEAFLKEELASEKPRKGVVNLLKEKIEQLTIIPSENKSEGVEVENADVVEAKEVVETEKPIDAIVLHKVKDIELILVPYQETLKKVDTSKLLYKDTSDKIGYQNIKNSLKSLSELRRTVDAERTTFTEPYRNVVSFANDKCGNLIGEIKEVESVLKVRKTSYDDALAKEKEEAKQKKAAELAEKEQKEQEKIQQEKEAEKGVIQSDVFQNKFSGIIGRAKSKLEPKEVEDENPFAASQETPKDLFDTSTQEAKKPIVLDDSGIINLKLSLLQQVLDLDTPDSEKYINAGKVIDSNVIKIINHVKANLL